MWKTFDTDIYERCFGKRKNKINNDYLDILDKDFNIKLLEKHKENIFSLIEKNIDIIKDIIFKDNLKSNNNDKNKKTKEYLCQILIMLPSVFICNVYFSRDKTEKNAKKKRILYQNVYIFVIN